VLEGEDTPAGYGMGFAPFASTRTVTGNNTVLSSSSSSGWTRVCCVQSLNYGFFITFLRQNDDTFHKKNILGNLFFIIHIFIFQVQYIRTTVLYIINCGTIVSWKLF
jgi:hypothetical protein